MICPDCGHTFARDTHTTIGFWAMVQQHAHDHLTGHIKPSPDIKPAMEIAPPVQHHRVVVRGRMPRATSLDTGESFAFDYPSTSAEAAVQAAKRDARNIFGTDTDAEVIIEQVYVSN